MEILLSIFIVLLFIFWVFSQSDHESEDYSYSEPDEDEDDDERDAWEYEYFGEYDYKFVPGQFHLEYEDANRLKTSRDFSLENLFFVPEKNTYFLQGRCHLRKANRTFRVDRIKRLTNLETGEIVTGKEASKKLLISHYEASPFYLFEKVWRNFEREVSCLVYVARLDGRFTQKEKDVIFNYLNELSKFKMGADHEALIMKELSYRYGLDYSQTIIRRNIKGLISEENKENFNPEKLISALDKIIGSTKKRNPVSQGGYEFVVKLLGR